MIFCIKHLQLKTREQQMPLHVAFRLRESRSTLLFSRKLDILQSYLIIPRKHTRHCPSRWDDIRTLSHCKWCEAGLCYGPNYFRDVLLCNMQNANLANLGVGLRAIFGTNLFSTSRLKAKTKTTTLHVCEALYADEAAVYHRQFSNTCLAFKISIKKDCHHDPRASSSQNHSQ